MAAKSIANHNVKGRRLMFVPPTESHAIKVENQQPGSREIQHSSSLGDPAKSKFIVTQPAPSGELQVPVNLHSPLSDGQSFEFCKIQTGAHSLSSTDSDMTKAIKNANKDLLESPPNLISPKNPLDDLTVGFDAEKQPKPEHLKLADEMTDFILSHLLREVKEEMPILVQRPSLVQPQKTGPAIKFFDKKGIKTDLFAIEKYVDEILTEVKFNRAEFMSEVNRPQSKDPLEHLFHMQNSEIGSYEHF